MKALSHPSVLLAALVLLALVVPGPLYLVSLALLGLPHVLWELAFLRSRYAGRWQVGWLMLVGLILGVQVILRTATWLGFFSSEALPVADLLVLMGLLVAVLAAPRSVGWRARVGALAAALVLVGVLQAGQMTLALLVLALVHNFTPVGLAWNLAQEDAAYRSLALRVTLVFLLPVVVFALGVAGWWPQPWVGIGQDWLLAQSPFSATAKSAVPDPAALQSAIASAMVLAQCLHYDQVLRVLPAAEAKRTGHQTMPASIQRWALVASGSLAFYFAWAFADARQLYAVAAGLHAWLEWPVLLLVLLAPQRHPESGPRWPPNFNPRYNQ
jgi:hypothetical protein